MANLSQNDRNIIAEHPLDTSREHLREPLRNIEQSYESSPLLFDGAADGPDLSPDLGPQKIILRLVSALLGHEAAYNLRSIVGNNDIASELSELFKNIRSGRYNYENYRVLSRLIVKLSIFGTLSSTSSSQSPGQHLIQTFLPPLMALSSRFQTHPFKAVNTLGESSSLRCSTR